MKKKFSTAWIGSRQVRKQRKYRANAPLHIKYKFMAGNVSKDLRKKIGKRSVEVRKGDIVKIMRGKLAGKSGKIASVDFKKQRVTVEGLQNQKKDGTKINVYFHPSKVQITELTDARGQKKEKKPEETKEKTENKENAQNKK
ncbi:MAG: 50S ribosomal protein L24 [Nanoarchaeota archaeon]|nr:50S ribosomal protein L24 [Nanoarchaeota archaeon]MBU4086577.1 50S ribosomal protein L24 [Nanoarchaeota archaeon]